MKASLIKNSVINSRNFKKVTQYLNSSYHGNCWGTTLFLVGGQKKRTPIEAYEMNDFLDENTYEVKKIKVGDILVLRYPNEDVAYSSEKAYFEECERGSYLSHTALYIGKGKYIHQAGYCGPVQIDTLKEIKNIYYTSTDISIARMVAKKPSKKRTKPKKARR
jgi:hypothetical protein